MKLSSKWSDVLLSEFFCTLAIFFLSLQAFSRMLNGMARFYSLINLPNMHNICHGLCWVLEQQTEQDILCQSLNFGTSRIDANDHIYLLAICCSLGFLNNHFLWCFSYILPECRNYQPFQNVNVIYKFPMKGVKHVVFFNLI